MENLLRMKTESSGATRTLTAIQRADRVLLKNAHIQLTGESDVANSNQTALYSLNRIGDHGPLETLGSLWKRSGTSGEHGDTGFGSHRDGEPEECRPRGKGEVTLAGLSTVPNTVLLVPESCSGSPTQIRIRKKQIMGQYRVMRI